jgi:hypothetical protein
MLAWPQAGVKGHSYKERGHTQLQVT